LRDCPSIVKRVLSWRETIGFDASNWRAVVLRHGIEFSAPYERFIPEWPSLPYLEIPPEIRNLHWRIQRGEGERLSAQIRFVRASEEIERLLKGELDPPTSTMERARNYRAPKRRLRAALKRLGAWRLVKLGGISHFDVIACGLYNNPPEISRAVKWVDLILKRTDQRQITT
jgi:hypothetical protein